MQSNKVYAAVLAGERIDQLGMRLYGTPNAYAMLVAANPTLDIWNPQAGFLIEVPRV